MSVVLWGSVVIVILLAAGACVLWVRARILSPMKSDQEGAFSLDSLERLYAEGQLSREEFRRLRNAALGLSAMRTPGEAASPSEAAATGEAAPPGESKPAEGPPPADKKPPGESSTPAQDDDGKQ